VQKMAGLKFRIYADVGDGKKTYQIDLFKTATKK